MFYYASTHHHKTASAYDCQSSFMI